MPGFKNGILVTDGTDIFLRHNSFDKEIADNRSTGQRLLPLGGFLDRRVQHRTGFILGNQFRWWQKGTQDIMISDGQETYAIVGFPGVHNHSYFDPRTNAYKLRGKTLESPEKERETRGKRRKLREKELELRKDELEVALPINGRAMVKAADVIFVAGEPMKFDEPTWQNYEASYTGKRGGKLLAISATDGKLLAEHRLPTAPVWDSIAVARGCLYISLADGSVECRGRAAE